MVSRKSISCPACGNKSNVVACRVKKWVYSKCVNCELVFLINPPSEAFFRRFYSYDDDVGLSLAIKRANPLQSLFLGSKLLTKPVILWGKLATRLRVKGAMGYGSKGGEVLDIGCGPGDFLIGMKARGWEVYGTEVGDRLVGVARERIGTGNVFKTKVERAFKVLAGKKFGMITLWHVLEHVTAPQKALESVSGLLRKDGVLIIEVPHSKSLNFRLFGKDWTLLMIPQHLHFWSKETLTAFLKGYGLEVKQVDYPSYFAFVFSSSLIKKYRSLLVLTPLLLPLSVVCSLIFSAVGRGDVIRVYAQRL